MRGNAGLGGTLQLLSAGFQPAGGDELDLVTTGGVVPSKFATFLDPFVVGQGFNTIDLVLGLNSVALKFLNAVGPVLAVIPVVLGSPGTIETIAFQSFTLNGTPNQRSLHAC